MIIECKKRVDGYKPVKGNEEEIIDFLWGQQREYFNNHDGYFVKLNDDGSIAVSDGQPSFKDYVAMEFNLTDDFDWVNWLFNAPNVRSIHKNQITNDIKILCLSPTLFKMQEGSILIFNKNSKTLHNVLNRTSVTIDDTLLENGYAVHGNNINQQIYTLEKMLMKPLDLEERMAIINRISILKNMKG